MVVELIYGVFDICCLWFVSLLRFFIKLGLLFLRKLVVFFNCLGFVLEFLYDLLFSNVVCLLLGMFEFLVCDFLVVLGNLLCNCCNFFFNVFIIILKLNII